MSHPLLSKFIVDFLQDEKASASVWKMGGALFYFPDHNSISVSDFVRASATLDAKVVPFSGRAAFIVRGNDVQPSQNR